MKLLLFAILFTSCASMAIQELNEKDRTFSKIETLETEKKDNYNGALGWLTKHTSESNSAVKMERSGQEKLVSKVRYTCKQYEADGFMGAYDIPIDFTVSISFKDKRVKTKIVAINYELSVGRLGRKKYPISKNDKDDIQKCQQSLYGEILSGMNSEKSSNDW